jgi:hypothetical protein
LDHEEQRDDHPWQKCQQKTRSGEIHGIVFFRVHMELTRLFSQASAAASYNVNPAPQMAG